MIALAFALLAAPASAAELPRACIKWSREIPEAKAAGVSRFSSVERVEGAGPFPNCDIVAETESFGVGWLMRAYMKEAVFSPCGKRLGKFSFSYKGDAWQEKVVTGLADFIAKNPEALAAAKECPAPPPAPAAPAPVEVSTATLTPSLPVEPVVPSTETPKAP
ncbi:MAG: hypothetical protein M0D55_15250 [Elusimicrobiota bacterium]|nr:MAG: hypothetical protein M0D55_15250 [Elusimicrobiota bacterium]